MSGRIFVVLGVVLAGLCLVRVFTVAASQDVEVYSATERDDSDSRGEEGRAEIRLTRPSEAESRIARDQEGYDQVPGAARISDRREDDLIVPRKVGRTIASEPSPVEARDGYAAPSPNGGPVSATATPHSALNAEVMEPRPFTASDATQRAAEVRRETITPSAPSGSRAYDIRNDGPLEARVDNPMPERPRVGVQEISLIVSDYGYFPSRVFVTQNVPVKIYMTTPSKVTMCFMQDNWGVKKGIVPGKVEEVTFTPDVPGDYRFYCPVKSIEGKITVREAPVVGQSSRGVASIVPAVLDAGRGNIPKNSEQLRALIED